MTYIHLLKIYVDDILLAIPENKDQNDLKSFNSYRKNIQFS